MDLLGKKRLWSEGNRASTGSARTYDQSFSFGNSTSGKVNYAFGRGSSRDMDLYAGGSDFNSVGHCGLDLNYPVAEYDGDGNVNLDYKVADIRNVDVNDCGVFREEGKANERKGHCFDLNLGLGEENLDLTEGLDLNQVIDNNFKEGKKLGKNRGEIFDLNISVNEDDIKDVRDEGSLNERKGHVFDLNLELLEDINGVSKSVVCEDMDSCKVVESDPLKDSSPNHDGFSSGLGLCCDVLGCAPIAISVAQSMSTASYPVAVELKTPTYNEGCATSKKSLRGRRGRKRTLSSDTCTKAALESDLRSTCRGRKSALFSDVDNNLSLSPNAGVVTGVSEVMGQEGPGEQNLHTPKVQLPHSSGNLSLGDMPVLDVFSVYSFLRSFSCSLFLSPFELEDFVCSLNCNTPSLLLDSIGVSLLKTLRKHLESIPDGMSQSASHCLRCHNWDFLDLITWPIFMVEYLLVFNSGLKAGFDLCSLKLFENAYHKQSPSVKIEMLRCLCNDLIDNDCIKSEINRRSQVTVPGADIVWGSKHLMDIPGCSVAQDHNKETVSNGNKCSLCRLDGKLICCDGCTAAFHSRCVGIVSNHLPLGGQWYCPECVIDEDKPHMKMGNVIRGADLLGTDAYGRIYFSCCGYLLVQEDCQSVSSSKYYHQDDIPAVVEVLKSSLSAFSTITSAVVRQWNFLFEIDGVKKYSGSREGLTIQFSEHSNTHLKVGEVVAEDASLVLANIGGEVPKAVFLKTYTVDHVMNSGNQVLSTTSSADASQAVTHSEETAEVNLQCTHSRVSEGFETQRKVSVMSIPSEEKNNDRGKPNHDLSRIDSKSYVNYYSLAQTAAVISEQLSRTKGLCDDVSFEQMNVIFMNFCWSNVLNAPVHALKENCGWCSPCRDPNNKRECLISMCSCIPSLENSSGKALLVRLEKSRKSRLVDVMFHICFNEERLQGLLLGPWLNPQYSESWRQSLLGANDIASVIVCLLQLVSNLHPLALSADWAKHVDYADAVGSDVHAVTTSMRGPPRNSLLQQRARYPALEVVMTSDTAIGLDLLWWRGGRLSRQPFSSKLLPRALASKAARRGGCRKIPGILYPDRSEFALRSRFVAWKVGVESSESVEQLALRVREFDANIKWDEIENSIVSLKSEWETSSQVKLFKGVTVSQKCMEGGFVKYLLEFIKGRPVPDIVLRYGSKVEESSDDRKKFWLEESHLPLHLMKDFEQKTLACGTDLLNFRKFSENIIGKRCTKRKGFSYLFSKAESSENYQCGHCNKDVLIRDAVSCQYCKGFFHKRHVRKTSGSVSAPSTYSCHKCGANSRVLSVASQKIKKSSRKNQVDKKATVAGPVRRSLRKTRFASLQAILRRTEPTNGGTDGNQGMEHEVNQ